MGMMRRKYRFVILLFAFMGLASCDSWFAYSPYEAQLDEAYHNTTDINLALINAADADDSQPFKVAVLSDTHYHFSKLQDAVEHINRNGNYAFAIVTGDIAENGLKQEFVYFYNIMANLKIPYLTAIGNHDYLSNGEKVYRQMFGVFNYTFVYNNVKFVLFDNTTYESSKAPDMDWLASEVVNDSGYDHVIPIAHIPPYDGQMENYAARYHGLMVENDIRASVHGHRHDFSIEQMYGDGVQYITVSSPQKRTYTELDITPSEIEIRKIEY